MRLTEVAAATPEVALAHFSALLEFETDCWDVHESLRDGGAGFVLVDVRGLEAWRTGHIACAVHLPHREITEELLDGFPGDTVFVVYCAGPHCNGADKAAVRLASLGRRVKKMIGGVTGWLDEGFALTQRALA